MAKYPHETNPAEPHKVLLLPELLEMILLRTETRTLLVSCQRVCHFWHEVIKESSNLQAALFFEPLKQSETAGIYYTSNTMLTDIVWPKYLRSNIQSGQYRWPGKWSRNLPTMEPKREEAFTRPEASWRRMLLQQPPRFCFMSRIEQKTTDGKEFYNLVTAKQEQQPELDCMEDVTSRIQDGRLIPCKIPWTFALPRSRKEIQNVPDVDDLDALWEMCLDVASGSRYVQRYIVGLMWRIPCNAPGLHNCHDMQ